jgi:hypothetical protein
MNLKLRMDSQEGKYENENKELIRIIDAIQCKSITYREKGAV